MPAGEAHDAPALHLQLLIAQAVTRERLRRHVDVATVELDVQPLRTPHEVRLSGGQAWGCGLERDV